MMVAGKAKLISGRAHGFDFQSQDGEIPPEHVFARLRDEKAMFEEMLRSGEGGVHMTFVLHLEIGTTFPVVYTGDLEKLEDFMSFVRMLVLSAPVNCVSQISEAWTLPDEALSDYRGGRVSERDDRLEVLQIMTCYRDRLLIAFFRMVRDESERVQRLEDHKVFYFRREGDVAGALNVMPFEDIPPEVRAGARKHLEEMMGGQGQEIVRALRALDSSVN